MRGPRTQAERDAQTVEMCFALLTGAVMAVASFLLCIGVLALIAGLLGRLPLEGRTWLNLAGSVCVTVFIGRVMYVLLRAPSGRSAGDTADLDAPEDPYRAGTDHVDHIETPGVATRANRTEGAGASGPQQSQPGRTSPDS